MTDGPEAPEKTTGAPAMHDARTATPPIAPLSVRLRPIILGGSAGWLVALVATSISWLNDGVAATTVLTCVAGLALGGVAWLWDARHARTAAQTSSAEILPRP